MSSSFMAPSPTESDKTQTVPDDFYDSYGHYKSPVSSSGTIKEEEAIDLENLTDFGSWTKDVANAAREQARINRKAFWIDDVSDTDTRFAKSQDSGHSAPRRSSCGVDNKLAKDGGSTTPRAPPKRVQVPSSHKTARREQASAGLRSIHSTPPHEDSRPKGYTNPFAPGKAAPGERILFPWNSTSFIPSDPSPKHHAAMREIAVKLRLLPAIHLLIQANQTDHTRQQAVRLTMDARSFALEMNASDALVARCNFFIGIAQYTNPKVAGTKFAIKHLEQATEASRGAYPEGKWAEEYLQHWSTLYDTRSPTARVVSWVLGTATSVINYVRGTPTSATFPKNSPSSERDGERISPNSAGFPAMAGERLDEIGDWSSWHSQSPVQASPVDMFMQSPVKDQWTGSSIIFNRAKLLQQLANPRSSTESLSQSVKQKSSGSSIAFDRANPGVRVQTSAFSSDSSYSSTPQTGQIQDHHSLNWSPRHLYGKGEIIPGKGDMKIIASPTRTASLHRDQHGPKTEYWEQMDMVRFNAKRNEQRPIQQAKRDKEAAEARTRELAARCRSYIPEGFVEPTKKGSFVTNSDAESPVSPKSSTVSGRLASYKKPTYFAQQTSYRGYTGADPSMPDEAQSSSEKSPAYGPE